MWVETAGDDIAATVSYARHADETMAVSARQTASTSYET